MGSPSAITIETGTLRGIIYTFEKAGDVLLMHSHGPKDVHVSIVARGSFRVHGPVIGETVVNEGAFIDVDPQGVTHEFVALTDNARVVNIVKGE